MYKIYALKEGNLRFREFLGIVHAEMQKVRLSHATKRQILNLGDKLGGLHGDTD